MTMARKWVFIDSERVCQEVMSHSFPAGSWDQVSGMELRLF